MCCHREGRVCAKVLHSHKVLFGGEGMTDRTIVIQQKINDQGHPLNATLLCVSQCEDHGGLGRNSAHAELNGKVVSESALGWKGGVGECTRWS
jgi:hypothetical protein